MKCPYHALPGRDAVSFASLSNCPTAVSGACLVRPVFPVRTKELAPNQADAKEAESDPAIPWRQESLRIGW